MHVSAPGQAYESVNTLQEESVVLQSFKLTITSCLLANQEFKEASTSQLKFCLARVVFAKFTATKKHRTLLHLSNINNFKYFLHVVHIGVICDQAWVNWIHMCVTAWEALCIHEFIISPRLAQLLPDPYLQFRGHATASLAYK